MTTREQGDLSQEAFQNALKAALGHNLRGPQGESVSAAPTYPEATGREPSQDFSDLPQSTRESFHQYLEALKKQLEDGKKELVPLIDARVQGKITQEQFEKKLDALKKQNDAKHVQASDKLYSALAHEGDLHPDSRKRILEASQAVTDLDGELWKQLSQELEIKDPVILATKLGKWFDEKIKDVDSWYSDLFGGARTDQR